MARYRTTEIVFLPGPYHPGIEVEYRGWPKMAGLEPVDDEAKAIVVYYKANKYSGELPPTPFDDRGRLHLPLVGLPVWKLGQKFRELEDNAGDDAQLMRAVGHHVMGGYRSSRTVFSANRWPTDDVEPYNEQARQIVEFIKDNPNAPRDEPPWDTFHHRVAPVRVAA